MVRGESGARWRREGDNSGGRIANAYKRIRLRKQHPKESSAIESAHQLTPIAARILAARGFTCDGKLSHYLTPTLKEGLPDPEGLKNLEAAANLIATTAAAGEGVAICCDFDVDGLSGGAQVHDLLLKAGVSSRVLVPNRFTEGYGLNEGMIREIAEQKIPLMITIDFGTTNSRELGLARELGVRTIVIDHHHVGDHEPGADIFINPHQKGCGFAEKILSASGLAWYLVTALRRVLPGAKEIDPRAYLDLACLGTICDMVPLLGANRVLAKKGLEMLQTTTRPGLIALKNVSSISSRVGCGDVSFALGPRLNAAGRMIHGEVVIDLLTTADTDKAGKLAHKLNTLNLERQETEAIVKEEAIAQLQRTKELPFGIAVWDPEFHTGVIGIVAQRLVEQFYRPAAVMGLDEQGTFKGSVRGIRGFSVVEALGGVRQHLLKFGGHEGAGGFSVDRKKVEKFAEAWNEECKRRLQSLELEPAIDADTEVRLGDIDTRLVEECKKFAPFGMGNPSPQLLVRGVEVTEVRTLKGTHSKVIISDGKAFLSGVFWRVAHHPALHVGAKVDIVFKPEISTYSGFAELVGNIQAVEVAAG